MNKEFIPTFIELMALDEIQQAIYLINMQKQVILTNHIVPNQESLQMLQISRKALNSIA